MNKDKAIQQLAEYLNISQDAIEVAEGWTLLPPRMKVHVCTLINDYIAQQHPVLKKIYANASRHDQARFNRIVERIQDEKRGIPPEDA